MCRRQTDAVDYVERLRVVDAVDTVSGEEGEAYEFGVAFACEAYFFCCWLLQKVGSVDLIQKILVNVLPVLPCLGISKSTFA